PAGIELAEQTLQGALQNGALRRREERAGARPAVPVRRDGYPFTLGELLCRGSHDPSRFHIRLLRSRVGPRTAREQYNRIDRRIRKHLGLRRKQEIPQPFLFQQPLVHTLPVGVHQQLVREYKSEAIPIAQPAHTDMKEIEVEVWSTD